MVLLNCWAIISYLHNSDTCRRAKPTADVTDSCTRQTTTTTTSKIYAEKKRAKYYTATNARTVCLFRLLLYRYNANDFLGKPSPCIRVLLYRLYIGFELIDSRNEAVVPYRRPNMVYGCRFVQMCIAYLFGSDRRNGIQTKYALVLCTRTINNRNRAWAGDEKIIIQNHNRFSRISSNVFFFFCLNVYG